MSIEIRELHIRAVVGAPPGQGRADRGARDDTEQERESLVALCVERVLETLSRKSER